MVGQVQDAVYSEGGVRGESGTGDRGQVGGTIEEQVTQSGQREDRSDNLEYE